MATVIAWAWNFGDGSPVSTEQNPQHVYADPGYYLVTHEQWDDAGEHSTIEYEIVILGRGVEYHWRFGDLTKLSVAFSPKYGIAPLIVRFYMNADYETIDTIQESVSHTYEHGGTYVVNMNMTDIFGEISAALPQTIVVSGVL